MAEESVQQPAAGSRRRLRQEKVGRVVSTKMDKTIVVEVERRVSHPLYRRVVRRRKKFYAHDEQNQCQVGDMVRIVESRPLSRLKRWRLAAVLRHARDAGLMAPTEVEAVEAAQAGSETPPAQKDQP